MNVLSLGMPAALCIFFAATAYAQSPVQSPTQPPAPVEQAVEIIHAEFGVFDTDASKKNVFTATPIVPRQQGKRYGWVIEVRTKKRSLSVREEYLLPNTTKPVSPQSTTNVILDIPLERRVQVSQRQLVPRDNRIYGEWSAGPNEPAGHRHLQIIVEDEIAADFEFDVQ